MLHRLFICVHALLDGAGNELEESVCNSLLALVPNLPSTDTMEWGIGKGAVQLGLLSLLSLPDGHTHCENAELGGYCCAFWLISTILSVTAMITDFVHGPGS